MKQLQPVEVDLAQRAAPCGAARVIQMSSCRNLVFRRSLNSMKNWPLAAYPLIVTATL
jgi:hypothetical protein